MTIETLPATFDGANLDIVIIGNGRWARASQIGTAFGFSNPADQIRKLHHRRKDEFTSSDTLVVELNTRGGRQLTRLFSQTGIAKLAMFADTPRAAAFRDWAARELTTVKAPPAADIEDMATQLARANLAIDVLTAQRDVLGQELLAFKPQLKKVLRYLQMGHAHTEVALLMRWKTEAPVRKARRQLEAMGLMAPSPRLAALRGVAQRNLVAGNNPHAGAARQVAHG